jgi:hypothetical protein
VARRSTWVEPTLLDQETQQVLITYPKPGFMHGYQFLPMGAGTGTKFYPQPILLADEYLLYPPRTWITVIPNSSAELVPLSLNEEQLWYMVHLDFQMTNNMVEYEILTYGLTTVHGRGICELLVKGHS